MLTFSQLGADPPPGAITFAAILGGSGTACAVNFDRFSGLAMQLLAAAASYYRLRQDAVADPHEPGYDVALASTYGALAISASDAAARAGARTASCLDLMTEIHKLLDRHRADDRDLAYTDMNREIRDYYDQVQALLATSPDGGAAPAPMQRPTLGRSLAAVGLIGLTIGLGTAAAVLVVRHR